MGRVKSRVKENNQEQSGIKMIVILKAFIILILLQGCEGSNKSEEKSIANVKKVVLKVEGADEFCYWEFEDNESLFKFDLGEVSALNSYKDSLKWALGKKSYIAAISKESTQKLDTKLFKNELDGDRINALLVHTGKVGEIRSINYLESQILNYQIERFPMFSKPTEFHAFIMRNSVKNKIRVYFGASDTEWPPHPTIIIEEVEKAQKNGWKLIRHLHNHYCKRDKDFVGILAPSLADAQYFKMLKERFDIEKALITNGVNTVVIESKDFDRFESH
jgi:hypothetical protein